MAQHPLAARFLRPFSMIGEGLAQAPWIGWVGWAIFFISILIQTGPGRFDSTFGVYLHYAHRLWNEQPLYDGTTLDGFNYWPASLMIYVPVLQLDPTLAGIIVISLTGSLFTYACYKFVDAAMLAQPRQVSAFMVTSILLLINIPAAWFNYKYIQAQVPMSAGMLLGAAAMMQARWRAASLWILLAAVAKPLAVVMLLLCAVLKRQMRLLLIAGLAAGLLLPFVFFDANYLAHEHATWAAKLMRMAHVMPTEWPFQADFQTMLDSAGIVVPPQIATAIRFMAAFGTLWMAWRISKVEHRTVFPFAVLLLSGCYITLFGPRNEFTSYMVVTPAMTMLALIQFGRNMSDTRGWLLIFGVLMLGFAWEFHYGRWVKPLVITLTYLWLIWLTLDVRRWVALIDGGEMAGREGAVVASETG